MIWELYPRVPVLILTTKKKLSAKQARKIKALVESQSLMHLPHGWHIQDVIR